MRVRLKGLNSVRKQLAGGITKTYYYAWKGGPQLPGQPGDPEFAAAYYGAVSKEIASKSDVVSGLVDAYEHSPEFDALSDHTKSDYKRQFRIIEGEFGDLPIDALSDRRTRAFFFDHRDKIAKTSKRQADYFWQVSGRVFSWSLDRGKIDANPCTRGRRVYSGTRVEFVWSDEDIAKFFAVASPPLKTALLAGVWTGQRQGDILKMKWSDYDGTHIRVAQAKSRGKKRLLIKAGIPLKKWLDKLSRDGDYIVSNDGAQWRSRNFSAAWRETAEQAGITDVKNQDLRGTAVTRLALSACTEAEIVAITGHTLAQVRSILDVHYLKKDTRLGDAAIKKMERKFKS
jgi:integrase